MSEEEKKRKLLEKWDKEQLANECVRQYLQYRKAKEYIDELQVKIDKAIEYIEHLRDEYFRRCIFGSSEDLSEIIHILEGEDNV